MPKPPDHLSATAQKKWLALQDEYSITDGGGLFLLNLIFECWDQAAAAREILEADGYVVENDTTGTKRANPAAAILKEARQTMLKALGMLSLDVSAIEEPGGD